VVRDVELGPYRIALVAPDILAAIEVDEGLPQRLASRRAMLLSRWGLMHAESVSPADAATWNADHLLALPRAEPHALRRVAEAADRDMARIRYGCGCR
jgi:hypothetical protein